jgi:hypothetical protein
MSAKHERRMAQLAPHSGASPRPAIVPPGQMVLSAMALRVQNALRGPGDQASLSAQRMALASSEASAERVRIAFGASSAQYAAAKHIIAPLAAAVAEATLAAKPPAPPKLVTTVGALRALLAGLPDSTRLDELPLVDVKWLAQAAAALAFAPPVQHCAERGPAARRDRPFGSMLIPSLADVLDA